MMYLKRTVQDIIQDEVLRERAAVLARAGEQLEDAFAQLRKIEARLAELTAPGLRGADEAVPIPGTAPSRGVHPSRTLVAQINQEIGAYNRQREAVRTRLYYLIVTREAMGLIHHQRLEEIYRLPARKHCLPER